MVGPSQCALQSPLCMVSSTVKPTLEHTRHPISLISGQTPQYSHTTRAYEWCRPSKKPVHCNTGQRELSSCSPSPKLVCWPRTRNGGWLGHLYLLPNGQWFQSCLAGRRPWGRPRTRKLLCHSAGLETPENHPGSSGECLSGVGSLDDPA